MKDYWVVKEHTLEEAIEAYPELWGKIGRMFDHLIVEDRLDIFSLVVDTCPHCYSDNKTCVCWNDM